MSDPDKNDSGRSPWLPVQIAPDDCDLELGRSHKTGILPLTFPCRRRAGVWFNVWAGSADLALALADLAIPRVDVRTHI